jgi:DNA-binding NtrC family response regulator
MKAADLDLRDLLEFNPGGGVIRFGGERALLLDAVALGLLRRALIETLGLSAARAVLTRFGYAHGWRTAETLRTAFPWDDESEWKKAGARLHTLQGIVRAEPTPHPAAAAPQPFAEAIWHDSYEAEQHLLLLGRADEPVCWTLTGFASGYLSCAHGREIFCVEDRCRGQGDAVCHVVARTAEEWGGALEAQRTLYLGACLDGALARLTAEIKAGEARLRARRRQLGHEAAREADPSGWVSRSPAMARTLDLARRVAQVDSTVLLTGESGAGKERVARFIHEESPRTAGPYVAVNCGAVPETLLESELFGHAKGSFTGASQDRAGLFEAAHGGTLLLDEIGDVPPAMQVKLLRVLQEREVRRVGENRSRRVDVRVIAATNRDLVADIHAARFRQDLYYRLRVVEIHIPPLRERREDVLPLARSFLASASARAGRKVTGFTPAAAERLLRHGWPGNVRELENAVERSVVLARRGQIDVEDLPDDLAPGLAPRADRGLRPLADMERDYILAAIRAEGGNRTRAARRLGIGVATLYRKLRQYEGGRTGE